MKKFKSMQEILAYMEGIEIPNELKNGTISHGKRTTICKHSTSTNYP
jgi:hypothetical protein